MTDPLRLPETQGDNVHINLTVDLHVSCQQDTSVTVLFTKQPGIRCVLDSQIQQVGSSDHASDLYLEATLAALTSCPCFHPVKAKVKQSHYGPGQTLMVPGV
jgi:hypothetical protein